MLLTPIKESYFWNGCFMLQKATTDQNAKKPCPISNIN